MKEPLSISHSCWIHGEEERARTSYPLVDPADGEVFAEVSLADASLVDSALRSAREAFERWRLVSAHERALVLHATAEAIRGNSELLALHLCREVGKPLRYAREEVLYAASLFDYFAEEGLRLTGQIPLKGYHREHVLIVREPVGVVAAILPFNYPLSALACKAGPALAAGCTVVAKPDEHTPVSTLFAARLAVEAGLPPGVLNVVTGPGAGAGRLLVESPVPRLVTFTGSTEVGKEIQATSARMVRKVILELGGHCPAIVCKDAPLREIMPQIAHQSLKNSGQYCYRVSRIYVHESHYEECLEEFVRIASSLRVGPPTDADSDLGPLNNAEVLARVEGQVQTALQEGARPALGGNLLETARRGYYFPPVVLTEVTPEMSIMREEVFGPVVMIRPFKDMERAIQEANDTSYGLAAYLFTRNLGDAMEWANRLEAGSVWVNRIHQAYPEAPFGGMKESGLGREKSRFGLEEFTELKTVYFSY